MTDVPENAATPADCPKCGKRRVDDATACPRCGLVFALWNPEENPALTRLDADGEVLWRKVQDNWGDPHGHESFLKHCLQVGTLAAAGRLYRQRLDEDPKDVLAAQMQSQVLAKAALGLSIHKSEAPTPVTRTRWFWVVVLVAMALGIAAGLFWRRLH
jgi:hypothetical protein